ncbi:uncharacterized protein LOC128889807 [Hylaeus anthracinus]|uniref:uncharacterized protein LOC128889807 n=1 Tax=Hylaeus anthracinus TaxID=313031 RepID=UPI0023B9FDF0|nr:uncharacterized protein LOC128889807 [Hylaeus anthracinus]
MALMKDLRKWMTMNSTMSTNRYCFDTELRKLRPAELYILVQILSLSDSWKRLMAIVPDREASDVPKFNAQHFSAIEQAAQQQKRSAAEIFLDEWGTMGRNRPTLRTLLDLLVKAELFRAADYLAGNVLKEELPKRPEYGPAAPIDISDEVIRKLLEEKDKQETNFNESLIFGLPSEVNDNKAMDNESQNSILERNMQSTKLISIKEEHNAKYLENIVNTDIQLKPIKASTNVEVSDLMKFSSEHNIEEGRRHDNLSIPTPRTSNNYLQEYEKQEMSSCELPVFVNKFGQSVEQTTSCREVLSDELPTFLNNNTYASSSSSNINSSSDSSNLSNLSINQNEMTSAELPQCIHELRVNSASDTDNTAAPKDDENITQYALRSQELPIMVLKYNK